MGDIHTLPSSWTDHFLVSWRFSGLQNLCKGRGGQLERSILETTGYKWFSEPVTSSSHGGGYRTYVNSEPSRICSDLRLWIDSRCIQPVLFWGLLPACATQRHGQKPWLSEAYVIHAWPCLIKAVEMACLILILNITLIQEEVPKVLKESAGRHLKKKPSSIDSLEFSNRMRATRKRPAPPLSRDISETTIPETINKVTDFYRKYTRDCVGLQHCISRPMAPSFQMSALSDLRLAIFSLNW